MKKLLISAFLLSASWLWGQNNPFLQADFWKKSPDVTAVQAEIAKGNSPSEANRANFDGVALAINNKAPFETIVYMLEQAGNSVNKHTHDGRIYLHWAANTGNHELVNYLLKKGSDIHKTDDKGATPLAFAAANGMAVPEVYEAFFKAGISPKAKYANGASLLHLAIANDKEFRLTEFLTRKGLTLKATDDTGNTVFDYATRSGDVDFLKKLLAKGVKPTEKALLFAAQGTRSSHVGLDTYRFLVEELKIKASATGDNGENALHYLIRKPKHEEIITYFLDKKVEVNQADKNGNTVFMNAAAGGELAIVKQIFPLVKDINAANQAGETALMQAVQSNSADVIEFLLANKADVNATDKKGNGLAYYLIQSYKPVRPGQKDEFATRLDLVQQAGYNLGAPQKNGNTIYHNAAAKNDVKLFQLLAGVKVDVNARNQEGITALHRAALVAKNAEVLRLLVDKGADRTLTTDFEETAFDLASENESLQAANVNLDFLK